MIVKLDYDDNFNDFINDINGKHLGVFHTLLDTARKDAEKKGVDSVTAFNSLSSIVRESAEGFAATNTEPMQDIIGVIINKPSFTYENATVEDVQKLAGSIFEYNVPFTFKDDVNEANYKPMLGYIAGKLALDLATKHFEVGDGGTTDHRHSPIGIVNADTHEPLVFDTSAYTPDTEPKKPSLNPFKYMFSSDYRRQYKANKAAYQKEVARHEFMRDRTARTMRSSVLYAADYLGQKLADVDCNKQVTMREYLLDNSMSKDEFKAMDTNRTPVREQIFNGLDGLVAEEFGDRQERQTSAVKAAPSKSKDLGK